ncbi:SxtJ family membrane protein [Thermodesulfobacteriota bacterium]
MTILQELSDEIKSFRPSVNDLRKLGITFLVVLTSLGCFLVWYKKPAGPYLIGIGILFGLLGCFLPKWLNPVYRFWMGLAVILGYFVSRILLTVIFYLVVTPIGLTMRLFGKDILDLKLKDRESYWQIRHENEFEPERSEKMY